MLDCPDKCRVDFIMEKLREATNNFEGLIND